MKKTHESPLIITDAKHISNGPMSKIKVSANIEQYEMKESSALSILVTRRRMQKTRNCLRSRVRDEAGKGFGMDAAVE